MGDSGMSDRKRKVLQAHAYKADGEVQGKLSKQPLCVKLPIEVDEWYRQQGAAFIRQVLTEKYNEGRSQ